MPHDALKPVTGARPSAVPVAEAAEPEETIVIDDIDELEDVPDADLPDPHRGSWPGSAPEVVEEHPRK